MEIRQGRGWADNRRGSPRAGQTGVGAGSGGSRKGGTGTAGPRRGAGTAGRRRERQQPARAQRSGAGARRGGPVPGDRGGGPFREAQGGPGVAETNRGATCSGAGPSTTEGPGARDTLGPLPPQGYLSVVGGEGGMGTPKPPAHDQPRCPLPPNSPHAYSVGPSKPSGRSPRPARSRERNPIQTQTKTQTTSPRLTKLPPPPAG